MSGSLAPIHDPSRARLSALEQQVAERERALATFKIDLQALQARYLAEVGALYAELHTLDAAIAETETRLGLRPPPEDSDDEPEAPPREDAAGCTSRSASSIDLKRIFHHVAKAIHPDRARDDAARYRRHSLMAEANRAYAERDEDRLRLILRAWERSSDAVVGDDPEAQALRLKRRTEELDDHLAQIEAEFADLRQSAIGRLHRRIDETRAQGWDLFAEMVSEVKREVARSKARLASMRR